jgi:hypothetical protein
MEMDFHRLKMTLKVIYSNMELVGFKSNYFFKKINCKQGTFNCKNESNK